MECGDSPPLWIFLLFDLTGEKKERNPKRCPGPALQRASWSNPPSANGGFTVADMKTGVATGQWRDMGVTTEAGP